MFHGALKKESYRNHFVQKYDTIEKINKFVYGHITTLLIRGYQRDFQIDFQGSFWTSEVAPQAFRETIKVNDWKQARRKASREEIESGHRLALISSRRPLRMAGERSEYQAGRLQGGILQSSTYSSRVTSHDTKHLIVHTSTASTCSFQSCLIL